MKDIEFTHINIYTDYIYTKNERRIGDSLYPVKIERVLEFRVLF